MFVRFFTQLNQYPKLILLVILALSAFFFVQARDGLFDPVSGSLRINSTVEPFIERDSGAYQQFLDAREAFGSEEVVVIALHNTEKEPVGLDYLLTLSHLKADIETNVPGISKVLSMLDIPQASGKCAGKSYFHQMGIGSVCLSVLEKYEHQISCLNSSSADKSSSAESDDNLEESLEESLEEGLEDELEDSPEQNLEESLEDSLDENLEESLDEDIADSGNSETEVDAEEDTSLDCALEKTDSSPQNIHADAEATIRKTVSSLKNHPLFQGDVLSKDASTAALIITFNPESKPESAETQQIIKQLLVKHQQNPKIADTLRIAYAGQPRQINKASRLIRQDMQLILPMSLLLIVIVLLIAFRSIKAVFVPLSVVLFGILWTAGIIGWIGDELNLVTMACAPIIVCVGSAYVIKFLNQYQTEALEMKQERSAADPPASIPQIISATLNSVTVPVTVTAITTVAGFIALMVSPIPAVQQLGLYSSVGIISINLFTLTLAPALLHYIYMPDLAPTEEGSSLLNRFFQLITEWLRLHSKRLIWIWLIIAGFAAFGMLGLSINSSTKTFPAESQLVKDLKLIENELSGTDTLRLLFKAETDSEGQQSSAKNPLKTAKTIYGLKELQDWLFQVNGATEIDNIKGLRIDKLHSPVDVLSHYRLGLDKLSDEEVVQFFEKTSENGPRFLSTAEDVLQVTIRMRSNGSTAFLALRDLLLLKVPELLPHLKFSYTGGGVLSSESANNIAQGQINSVFLALIIVFVILSLLFLSWKMGVIALFPNVITILIFFGSLGWLDIPIGVTISVIAAIALGIGVDDTIHFLSHYNENANKLRNKREASLKTLPIVARPMLFSTIALSAGFILFAQSEMESQVLFGTFTAFTLLVCLAIDMNFLPSVVMETGLITVWDYVGLKFDEEFIGGIDLFQNMTVREAKIASLMAYPEDLKQGELLFSEGDIGDEMYVILEGSISIFLEKNGKRTDLVRLEKGNTFGEMGLFRKAERSASAEAAEKTRLLVVNRDCLDPLKKRNPKIAAKLFLNLANRLQSSLKDTDERLLAQKDFNLTSLEAKLNNDEKLAEQEISIKPEDLWESLGAKWRHKLQSFSETYKVARGKRLSKIKNDKGDFLFITSGTVEIASIVSAKNDTFSVGYCWTRKDFDLIGEFSLCTANETATARAIARQDSTLLQFTETKLLALAKHEPRLAAQFLEDVVCLLSDQLAIADKRLQNH
jgi:predicted RND superfamily exporter protein/CRP-like cAMP-binding protein